MNNEWFSISWNNYIVIGIGLRSFNNGYELGVMLPFFTMSFLFGDYK